MTIEDAIVDLIARIKSVSPDAVVRVKRRSGEEASILAYAPVVDESSIKAQTQEFTLNLLTNEGLDLQVLLYDIAKSLPPTE